MGLAQKTNEPFIDGILEVANTIRNEHDPPWSSNELDHALLFLSYIKQYELSALMRDPARTLTTAALVAGVADATMRGQFVRSTSRALSVRRSTRRLTMSKATSTSRRHRCTAPRSITGARAR